MKIGRFTFASALFVASMPLMAHDGMHGPGSQYDTDDSGGLSLAEFKAYLAASGGDLKQAEARFKSLDADKDGELSSSEFIKGLQKTEKAG